MKIKHISIHNLNTPLCIRFAQSNNSAKTSNSVIVRLETEAGIISYGESCPRTYVTKENYNSVYKDLKSIEKECSQRSFDSFDAIHEYMCFYLPKRIGLAAICALEIAVLDAWSRETQTSLVEILGGKRNLLIGKRCLFSSFDD